MKIVTPEQMSAIDKCAINDYGIPGMLLMENAACAVVSEALKMLGDLRDKIVTAVAGRGNNGGDAFAAARLLHSRGADVRVYLTGGKAGISGDALANASILEGIGINIIEILTEKDIELLASDMAKSSLVLDGIFGTGLGREVTGLAAEVIRSMNASGRPILAIDIPSGINGADGSVRGVSIKADVTVTFCMPKTGLVVNPGCEYAGRLIVANIGIPACALKSRDVRCELIDADMAANLIPRRRQNSNKGDYGKVLIITGSAGMAGSGCLAAAAALRSGAGLVYTGVPESLAGIYNSSAAEPVVLPLADGGKGCLAGESAGQILEYMKKVNVAAIGPGLSSSDAVRGVVRKVIVNGSVPIVIDADALNVVSADASILKSLGADAVITPHPGEMSRLTGLSTAEIQRDRIGVAGRFASEYGVITVLKGNRTVVAMPDGRIYVNPTGNAGMATAGTGDVLTGIIAGLAAQGASLEAAAVTGVYLHGLAGDKAAESLGMHGMLAGDVVLNLPYAIKELVKN